ncbi:MAG TPA: hypothetical protein VNI61_06235, partial [Gemmatimonadales bacterium]|jgi:hypothetical protein|nr:hypothetical protein [Candidatus Rokubacteria bacterium]HXF95684.1 hypothetical protein [Gemmatimonadales bacterium]
MAFSGGSYDEVRRWLWNFLTSHAKREDPRFEVEVEAGDAREGKSYGARLVLGPHRSDGLELDYAEVAARRGDLAWCRALAERVRRHARAVIAGAGERRAGVG